MEKIIAIILIIIVAALLSFLLWKWWNPTYEVRQEKISHLMGQFFEEHDMREKNRLLAAMWYWAVGFQDLEDRVEELTRHVY